MNSYRKELWFDTRDGREFINITPQVDECLEESKLLDIILIVCVV